MYLYFTKSLLIYLLKKCVEETLLLTLTAWIVTKYYWENASSAIASSAIASSREPLCAPKRWPGSDTVAWPAGSQGCCERGPRIETRGSHHIVAHPISCQIGFSRSGVRVMLTTCKNMAFILKCIGRLSTKYYHSSLNPNRLDRLRILLRKCIKCDCVITGTLKWPRKRWPGSDTRWLGLLVHGAGVREVRRSKPGVATTLLLTLFRVR